MTVNRRTFATALGLALAPALAGRTALAAEPLSADPVEWIDLWPGGPAGAPGLSLSEVIDERSTDPALPDRAMHGIARPRMAVFRPERPNGAAVLVTPGGGYRRVVVDREGFEIGRWLAARGFTAFILFYRLPGDGWAAGPDVSLCDAQRAMRLIRHQATSFTVDPQRVSVLGFSAGGHVCADLATRFAATVYPPVDVADRQSARPHSAAPIYPVVSMSAPDAHAGSREMLVGREAAATLEAAHSPHCTVPGDAPPFFLVHAEDDDVVPVTNTLLLRAALKDRAIAVETHLFEKGGHGFGLRRAKGKPVEVWPELWRAWAQTTGLAT